VWLVEIQKLTPATVARRVIAARTLWRRAIRWKLAAELSPLPAAEAQQWSQQKVQQSAAVQGRR
jgi:hypothetical protein